jgi:hypothetical protein
MVCPILKSKEKKRTSAKIGREKVDVFLPQTKHSQWAARLTGESGPQKKALNSIDEIGCLSYVQPA